MWRSRAAPAGSYSVEMARFPHNDIISLVGERPAYDLAESVGPDLRVSELLDDAARRQLADLALGYGTAPGDARLRSAVAETHGVGPDDVIITVGGIQTLFLAAFTLCDRGDEVVTTSPWFPLVGNVLHAVGAELRLVRLSFDRGYRVDADEVGERLTKRTRLVILTSPHNPSGVAIAPDAIRAVAARMAEVCPGAYLLVDETYREAAYGDDPIAPSCAALGEKIICSGSLSKCHGAPGLRLGWAITGDPALREQFKVGKFNTVISCSAVDEFLALKLFEQRERILDQRRRRLAAGLNACARWASDNERLVEWVRPDAGAILCARLRRSSFDDAAVDRFHARLAAAGVRVASGTWFDDEPRVFRLGFGLLAPSNLDAALERLSAALRED
jgi:aspartate/methionine/tyrosine aminotransferase